MAFLAVSAIGHFNPRFPRGKRRHGDNVFCRSVAISIHASREGSDQRKNPSGQQSGRFQSTLPAREATGKQITANYKALDFNPRFPRGKRRRRHHNEHKEPRDFNPRFPRGKRLWPICINELFIRFQSTLPAREATFRIPAVLYSCRFQSTLPAREATLSILDSKKRTPYFNPRFPRGKRPI